MGNFKHGQIWDETKRDIYQHLITEDTKYGLAGRSHSAVCFEQMVDDSHETTRVSRKILISHLPSSGGVGFVNLRLGLHNSSLAFPRHSPKFGSLDHQYNPICHYYIVIDIITLLLQTRNGDTQGLQSPSNRLGAVWLQQTQTRAIFVWLLNGGRASRGSKEENHL